MAMKVSVALCTYNGERYLQQQLDSIARQTYQVDELVVCDDVSTDGTEEIIKRFSARVSFPVRFFTNERTLGSTANFERAIWQCRGDVIALCDQDDIWAPSKIEEQVSCISGAGGVFCDGELIRAGGTPLNQSLWNSFGFNRSMRGSVDNGNPLAALARGNFVTGATLMFKADLRARFSPIPEEWVHDAWIAWMLCLHSSIAMVTSRLISYRIHAEQQIGANLRPLYERMARDKGEAITRHEMELPRLQLLLNRIESADSVRAAEYAKTIREKILFIEARIALLRKGRMLRVARVVPELGGYMRFGRGARSIAGDLIF